jgi:hypothetical protein
LGARPLLRARLAISTLDEDFEAYATKHVDRPLANAAAAPLDDLLAAAGQPA